MIVVNPDNTSHIIKFVPRYTPITALTFITYNEATQVSNTINNSYVVVDGFLELSFSNIFAEGDKLQFEIQESEQVVYRGKIFATTQTPQDYKLTKDLYFYE